MPTNKVIKTVTDFENGDQLVLHLTDSKFAGYKSQKIWELFYAEKIENGHYYTHQTEYFPECNFNDAYSALRIRLNSNNSMNESGQGWALQAFLTKETA